LKERLKLFDKADRQYSMRKQCALLGINRATLYYKPVGINNMDCEMMNLLDEQYTKAPFYGVLRMREFLRSKGYEVGKEHVRTLLRKMGLEAIYPRMNLSKPIIEHKVYPYLLRGVIIERPNQVWSSDITYIRLMYGFAYLMAIIDWNSRYVLSWRLSNSLDGSFCIEAIKEALRNYGTPEIFNSDQGSQFSSSSFTNILSEAGILISMDGRGRAHDNIFIERLWRTVKYENIYLNDYIDIPQARKGLMDYFQFYNKERIHQSLGYKTPEQVYLGGMKESSSELQKSFILPSVRV